MSNPSVNCARAPATRWCAQDVTERVALQAALAALTQAEREAIETTFFGGLTHAEAAVRLNQPLGTIKTRIRSGLYKLRNAPTAEAGKI